MFTPESLVNNTNCIEKTESLVNILYIYNNCITPESLVNILYIYNNCIEKTESGDN